MTRSIPDGTDTAGLTADEKRELLKRILQKRRASSSSFAMSAQQRGIWHAYQRDPESSAYNVFLPARIRSPLDADALRRAMQLLVDRHPALRTTFQESSGQLRQTVQPAMSPGFVSCPAKGQDDSWVRQRILTDVAKPFDLANGPLLRLTVFDRTPADQIVLATAHHIVTDFWSLVLLMNELRTIYPAILHGQDPDLPSAAGNYGDFVREQETLLQSDQVHRLREYWATQYHGADHVLDWPLDRRRPDRFTGRADVIPMHLDESLTRRLRDLAVRCGATINAVLLTAIAVLIYRYTAQRHFLLGSPFSGRRQRKYEQTVGLFSGVLPIRADVDQASTFDDLVRATAQRMVAALEHEAYPLSEIVRDAAPVRDVSRSPLMQVLCTFENSQDRSESGRAKFLMPQHGQVDVRHDVGGMLQEAFSVDHPTCHYDLEFAFESSGKTIDGMLCFCRDLFDRASMQQMEMNFQSLLDQLVTQPRVPLSRAFADASPESDDTGIFGDIDVQPPRSMLQGFEQACAQFPDRIAVTSGDVSWSYGQLDSISRSIAIGLANQGVGRGDIVPIVCRSNAAVVPAVLGVLRSGAAVCPLDASMASVSADDLVVQTGCPLAIVDAQGRQYLDQALGRAKQVTLWDLKETVSATELSDDRLPEIAGDDLAYVIYTSGSTSGPKGVKVSHRAIGNTLAWRRAAVPLAADDAVLAWMSVQFDAGFGVMMTTLDQGSRLVWQSSALDLASVVQAVDRDRVTVLPGTPGMVAAVLDRLDLDDCQVRQVWSGGEDLTDDLVQRVAKIPDAELWNFYGPTETAVEATAYRVDFQADVRRPIPIGRPVANSRVAVVDEAGQGVPDGIPGQIVIVGPGLADGYLDDDVLTDQRFVRWSMNRVYQRGTDQSTDGTRAYLTGDRGRINAQRQLMFLGRMDDQAKLRGYRIDLSEVQRAYQQMDAVQDAAACIVGTGSDARLHVFVVTELASDLVGNAERLAKYKRPDQVHRIAAIPRTSGGKIDRRRLKQIALESTGRSEISCIAPEGPLESYLVEQWADVLKTDAVSTSENFFDLGGSSLLAATLTSRLSDELGVRVPPALVFDLADIRTMSKRLLDLYPSQLEARFGVEVFQNTMAANGLDQARVGSDPLIAAWKPSGNRTPLFLVHPPGGIVVCYKDLASAVHPDQPLYAVRSRGLHGDERLPATVVEMADEYAAAIDRTYPDGMVSVGGWSLGGIFAVELTRQLKRRRRRVQRLWLFDTTLDAAASDPSASSNSPAHIGREYGLDMTLQDLSELAPEEQLPFLWDHAKKLGVLHDDAPEGVVRQTLEDLQRLFHHHVQLASGYAMEPIDVPVTLVRPRDVPVQLVGPEDRGWSAWTGSLDVLWVPGHHHSMLSMPHVKTWAASDLGCQ